MKKKSLALCLLAASVIVAAMLLLWSKPVSFWEMTGTNRDDVYHVNVSATEIGIKDGHIDNHTYVLEDFPTEDSTISELLDLLEDCTYRPSLRNLLPWPADSMETDGKVSDYFVHIGFTWGDKGEHFVTLSYMDTNLISLSLHDDSGLLVYRPTDRDTLDKVGEFMKEYGQPA